MDKKQALEESIKLWTRIAEKAHMEQVVDKWNIPGPWDIYCHNCPCCEYVKDLKGYFSGDLCYECPMYEQWMFYADEPMKFPCVYSTTPYQRWSDCTESGERGMLWYDLEFFCLLVAELACEALNECSI